MAAAHQHSGEEGKRWKLLNRLFPWRRSSSTGRAPCGPTGRSGRASTSSVRRTSPVDLNLGDPSPNHLPAVSGTATPAPTMTSRRKRTSSCDAKYRSAQVATVAAGDGPPLTVPPLTAPPQEKEELGALRHLAVELHTALRMSEEENVVLKAKLQTLDDLGLIGDDQPEHKLDQLIDDLRDIGSVQHSPFSSPSNQRRNMRDLSRIMQQRQRELRLVRAELLQTQTELLFTQVELDQVRRCLRRLDHRLLYAEEELTMGRQNLLQASISKQRLMQELQRTRGLLISCWSRVRVLEEQQQRLHLRQHPSISDAF